MTTSRSFLKSSMIQPGARHGAVIEIVPNTPALASGSFRSLAPGVFQLDLTGGPTQIVAIVHGSVCTEAKLPQDALSGLTAPVAAPRRFARYAAIKATTRFGKHFELDDKGAPSTGAFRFTESGTMELTFPTGDVNLVLIARGYIYVEEVPPADVLAGLIGAKLGTEDGPEEVVAPVQESKPASVAPVTEAKALPLPLPLPPSPPALPASPVLIKK